MQQIGIQLAFQILGRAFKTLRENQKLGREFEKLGSVFVLQHGQCYPNQPRYNNVFVSRRKQDPSLNTMKLLKFFP